MFPSHGQSSSSPVPKGSMEAPNFQSLRHYALESGGARIALGQDFWTKGNRIWKAPYQPFDFQEDVVLWSKTEHSLSLQFDKVFPNESYAARMSEPELSAAIQSVFPAIDEDTKRSTFLDRVSNGNPATLTIRLGSTQLISAVGFTYSPWDRRPESPICVEAGMYGEADSLPDGAEVLMRIDEEDTKQIIVGYIRPNDDYWDRQINTGWVEFAPRWADCVRIRFPYSGTRLYFAYAAGPSSIWCRWGFLLKRLVLLQCGGAVVFGKENQSNSFKVLNRPCVEDGAVEPPDCEEFIYDDEFAKLMHQLAHLEATGACKSLQLHPVLSHVFDFL